MKRIILIFYLIIYATPAFSYEVIEVCATYLSTGKKYKVQTHVYSGSELNSRTKSFDYNSFSKYSVIFWGQNEATVIELDFSIAGISIFGSTGSDQKGYRWELKPSTIFCF